MATQGTSGTTAPLLELKAITKSFQGVRALKGVTFELRPGEVHALVGENGAGKSTLIRVVTGAHAPDAGELWIGGRQIVRNEPRLAHRLGVAAIYQQPALFRELSVAENLALALEPASPWRRVRWGDRRLRATELLARVGARISPDQLVSSLSMPEQQLVEIAKALGSGARVLIMDEPTASLSPDDVRTLSSLIRTLRSEGVGILYISHRLEEVLDLAERVTVLRDGESLGTFQTRSMDEAALIRLMVGRDVGLEFPASDVTRGGVRLEARGLGCQAAGLSGMDFSLRAGEVVSLSGLVGAGRTELARILFGITPADAGVLRVDGVEVQVDSPRSAIAAGICYLPEDRRRHGVVGEMSVTENTSLAVLDRLFPSGWVRGEPERALARKYAAELRVKTPSVDAAVGTLSGGNQQKVALGRWLAAEPKVLVLDEPTQGVDVGAKSEIHRLIRALADRGLAVLVISSDLTEALGLGDRVWVMARGRLCAELKRGEATPERVMSLALQTSGTT